MPMLLLILDFETTGLSPDSARPIELGAVLYSVEQQTTLAQASTLIPTWSNPAEAVNRISVGASQAAGVVSSETVQLMGRWMDRSDYLVAHNAAFDRRWMGRYGMPQPVKPWLCTMEDFIWPKAAKPRSSLINLALDHGIGVSSAHRALTDCQLIAALFDRMPNLAEMVQRAIDRSQSPEKTVIAQVSYDDRQLAKDHGFRWDKQKRVWRQTLKACEVELGYFPFQVTVEESDESPAAQSISEVVPVPAARAIPNPPPAPPVRPTPPIDRPVALPPPPSIDDLPF